VPETHVCNCPNIVHYSLKLFLHPASYSSLSPCVKAAAFYRPLTTKHMLQYIPVRRLKDRQVLGPYRFRVMIIHCITGVAPVAQWIHLSTAEHDMRKKLIASHDTENVNICSKKRARVCACGIRKRGSNNLI